MRRFKWDTAIFDVSLPNQRPFRSPQSFYKQPIFQLDHQSFEETSGVRGRPAASCHTFHILRSRDIAHSRRPLAEIVVAGLVKYGCACRAGQGSHQKPPGRVSCILQTDDHRKRWLLRRILIESLAERKERARVSRTLFWRRFHSEQSSRLLRFAQTAHQRLVSKTLEASEEIESHRRAREKPCLKVPRTS